MKTISILISPDGEVKAEASGFTGQACERAMKPILEALGKATDVKRKPEYYQTQTQQQKAGQ